MPQAMYRAMRADSDRLPRLGRSARGLGVRVEGLKIDIVVAVEGTVSPGNGGMSVALDDAQNLPKHRLPKSLGGEGRDPVFRMNREDIIPELRVRADAYPHGLVEPSICCTLSDFELRLADTRPFWGLYA